MRKVNYILVLVFFFS